MRWGVCETADADETNVVRQTLKCNMRNALVSEPSDSVYWI